MTSPYVEKREEGYWVAGTRVSLESVVFAFLDGLMPESIAAECFPTLTLEQVYGALAYYLGHRREIDAYIEEVEASREAAREAHHDSAFAREMAAARRQMQASQP